MSQEFPPTPPQGGMAGPDPATGPALPPLSAAHVQTAVVSPVPIAPHPPFSPAMMGRFDLMLASSLLLLAVLASIALAILARKKKLRRSAAWFGLAIPGIALAFGIFRLVVPAALTSCALPGACSGIIHHQGSYFPSPVTLYEIKLLEAYFPGYHTDSLGAPLVSRAGGFRPDTILITFENTSKYPLHADRFAFVNAEGVRARPFAPYARPPQSRYENGITWVSVDKYTEAEQKSWPDISDRFAVYPAVIFPGEKGFLETRHLNQWFEVGDFIPFYDGKRVIDIRSLGMRHGCQVLQNGTSYCRYLTKQDLLNQTLTELGGGFQNTIAIFSTPLANYLSHRGRPEDPLGNTVRVVTVASKNPSAELMPPCSVAEDPTVLLPGQKLQQSLVIRDYPWPELSLHHFAFGIRTYFSGKPSSAKVDTFPVSVTAPATISGVSQEFSRHIEYSSKNRYYRYTVMPICPLNPMIVALDGDVAECEATAPRAVRAGQEYDVTFRVKNIGRQTWNGRYYMADQTTRRDLGVTESARLATQVPPGGTATFTVRARAPDAGAVIHGKWGMMRAAEGSSPGGSLAKACGFDIAVMAPTPPLLAACTVTTAPRAMHGKSYPAIVTLKNEGSAAWTPSTQYLLDHAWDYVGQASPKAIGLPKNIAPGETVEIPVTLSGAYTGGYADRYQDARYFNVAQGWPQARGMDNNLVQWTMYDTQKGYFGRSCILQNQIVDARVADLNEALCRASAPATVPRGGSFELSLQLQNAGTTVWKYPSHYLVDKDWAAHQAYSPFAAALPRDVQPGESINAVVKVQAPQTAGRYDLTWSMVQAGKEWFGQECKVSVQVSSEIASSSAASVSTQSSSLSSVASSAMLSSSSVSTSLPSSSMPSSDAASSSSDAQRSSYAASSAPICGNGIMETGEECDAGSANAGAPDAPCRANCRLPFCGDAIVDLLKGEQCDDGNRKPGDGCGRACLTERCGDGIVTRSMGEVCDDGNASDEGPCRSDCKAYAYCGDGLVQPPETCDDGNMLAGDSCSPDCK